jgi:hypothetical protein
MGHLFRWMASSAAMAVLAVAPVFGQAPAEPEVQEIDVPLPHLVRVSGDGAHVQRDTGSVDAVAGEHLAFGDRLMAAGAQVQVLWSDGSLVSLDRQAVVDVLAPDLLALTAGRAVIVTPRGAETPLRVDTPASVVVAAEGTEVRLSVEDASADVQVVRGRADVRQGEQAVSVSAGHRLAVRDGLAPGTPQAFNTAAFDSFVEWAREPVVAAERSTSRGYLEDPRLEAYADVFDRHGQWEQDAVYGQVWFPSVGADWRPFSQGYWQPLAGAYGPTWVGLDPWGWPTHHYGAWDVNRGGRWFWRPGRRWSPGRVQWSVGPGYVGWSPLGVRNDVPWAWNRLATPPRATQRGVYPSGTLDPFRAWTVIPTERYGHRGGISAYAVDARTLSNLSAFVTQRVAPPVRYGGYGSPTLVVPATPGGYPGRATGRGGYGTRTGDDTTTTLRRGVPPTRVDPPVPGPYGGPGAAPADDPYERANEVMVPRGRTRTPPPADPPATGAPQRTGTPQRQRQPPPKPPADAPTRPAPPEAASAEAASAQPRSAPPSRGLSTPQRTPHRSTPGRAVTRPPA